MNLYPANVPEEVVERTHATKRRHDLPDVKRSSAGLWTDGKPGRRIRE
jgi:hypothetical protein